MTFISVWVLVMWTDCDTCSREPWVHEVFPTEVSCSLQANRLHSLQFSSHTRWRCMKPSVSEMALPR